MLRHHEDFRPLFFHAAYFGLLALGFQRGAVDWWSVPLVMLLCVTSFQGAVQTHNAIHSPVFRKRWANKIYQVVLTLIYGHPVSSYVPGHNLSHHKHTQTRRDVMRTTKTRFRYNGYHGIHHNHPPLHWSKTPEAHRDRYGGKIHPGLEQASLPAYAWTTFILGRRLRYDGIPVVLPVEGPDESWLPTPEQTLADLGAETLDPTAI